MAAKSGSISPRSTAKAKSVQTKCDRRAAAGKFSATNLDRLIHERTRLAIVSALAVNDSLTFNELKHCCAPPTAI